MNQRAIIIASILFAVILLGLVALVFIQRSTIDEEITVSDTPATVPTETVRINGVHIFKNGKHTVLGEIMVKGTCTLIDSEAVVRESAPEQVSIDVETLESDDPACEPTQTSRRFLSEFSASGEAVLSATFNGVPAILNLVEGDPEKGLKLDDEFFFKG